VTKLDDYLANSNNENTAVFVSRIIDVAIIYGQQNFTISDFPGKEEGMPFEWWKDDQYVSENI